MGFEYPWVLTLLVLIPAAHYFRRKYVPRTGFSAVGYVNRGLRPHFIKKHGSAILYAMFIFFTVFALANLHYEIIWEKTHLESKWLMIVQDLSGSMNKPSAEDTPMTLGDVTLAGAEAFIDMREQNDFIGLIGFSSYAKLICPPTFDKKILRQKLQLMSKDADSIVFRELSIGGATNASYACWLAVCAFLMLLPEENQLSFEELADLRHSLLGATLGEVVVPGKLKDIEFGHGMAIVMFTDGKIDANKSAVDVRKGLPNFVNVVKLIKKLGIRLYLIVAGGDVNPEVRDAIGSREENTGAGGIFFMPGTLNLETIKEAYRIIHEMEKNELLVRLERKKKSTRPVFTGAGMVALIAYWSLSVAPWTRRL
jgi:hypothetical protein